jgi:hypothetical protein
MHHLHLMHTSILPPILVTALIQWFLGALWYSLLFVKPWMALTGHVKGERPKGAAVAMAVSFLGGVILSFILLHVVLWSGASTWCTGALVGFICWLGFIAVPLCSEKMYEQRPFKLFAINAGYWLTSLLISGAVLAAWH